jgi:hypothetical protein
LGPALFTQVLGADPTDWYIEVDGVLDSDYYSLYPFETDESLTIGFSKFGEMINEATGTGLNYSGRDPFANEGVLDEYWLQGWLADIRYIHRVYGGRYIWAFATYADLVATGGDWINEATDRYGAPHGGRKTSGIASSDPIEVLYDGPRRFVGKTVTHLNDTAEGATWPVIDVIFTIIFNKVKKEVIVLKDIKLRIDQKILESPVNVQFSNRGEWDLGPSPNWKSYAHFWHQYFDTCYDADWTMAKTILREYRFYDDFFVWPQNEWYFIIEHPSVQPDWPWGLPIVPRSEYVYVNGIWQRPGIDYDMDYNRGLIQFYFDLFEDEVEIFFKLHKLEEDLNGGFPMSTPHLYDLAQIISQDLTHVGFAAFWPVLSDYTVDGWDRALDPLIVANEPDMLPVPSEADIPYVVGEWDMMLDYDEATTNFGDQFRGVTVYGLVNYHDADDMQGNDLNGDLAVENQVDTEVKYQLAEVFTPWGLLSAVHKDTNRWVEFYTVTTSDYEFAQLGLDLYIYLDNKPFTYAPVWEEYCSFSERVLWDGELRIPWRSVYASWDYTLMTYSDGYAGIWIDADDVPAPGTEIKMLYSTDTFYRSWEDYTFEWGWTGYEFLPDYDAWFDFIAFEDWLGVYHQFDMAVEYEILTMPDVQLSPGDSFTLSGDFDFYAEDIKVFKEDTSEILCEGQWFEPDWRHKANNGIFSIDFYYFDFHWWVTPPSGVDVHIEWAHLDVDYAIYVDWNGTHFNSTATFNINGDGLSDPWGYGPYPGPLYVERIPGRYEWIEVGRDAASVDSAGAALVSAAFKNKQVEIGLAGVDMWDPEIANQIPYVMHKFGTGDAMIDYHYDYLTGDHRTALKDDWCTTWPVASSNMIGVGGPLANVLAWYGNDFTDAFFGVSMFTDYAGWENNIAALTCWNKNAYASDEDTGYAVIGTYKDINGTVLLLMWGHWGRDTYYATKWFHEEGIFQLQEAPLHLTSIILEIDYTVHEPAVSIVECLGTISETEWYHGYYKGGIHPDP